MRILVVGGGGREHALVWALKHDLPEATLFTAPGNPGTAQLGTNLDIPATAVEHLVDAVRAQRIDVTIIGPEAPLSLGLADRLRAGGRHVFGPNQAAAQIESSKAFAKDVMAKAGVPTAKSRTFRSLTDARDYIDRHPEPLVVKASGLAAGKGVVICATRAEAQRAAQTMLEELAFGDAGREIVVEDFLEGEELSVLALTDGERMVILPPAQDHKRLLDHDTGPNTGGMGAYCPVSLSTPRLLERVRREVFEPTLRELASRGMPYQGVLYAGLMLGAGGAINVLEFNCRFGDPETQAVLPVLPAGSLAHLPAIAGGNWRPARTVLPSVGSAVCTVLVARGYPDTPETGAAITIPQDPGGGDDVLIFHAGTCADRDGTIRVAGGRVLGVTGLARSVPAAAKKSVAAAERIAFAGKAYRRDIGWREIARAGAA
ncbi:MAG TPA: phosphoribosylamine--glycine ligase [Gemmatimonadales bacterium]|nr:phosphoribosylamine--glycine ligase [Gemmatimonadales bacterium]